MTARLPALRVSRLCSGSKNPSRGRRGAQAEEMELRAGGPAGNIGRIEFHKGHCAEFSRTLISTRVGGDDGSLERVSPRGLGNQYLELAEDGGRWEVPLPTHQAGFTEHREESSEGSHFHTGEELALN